MFSIKSIKPAALLLMLCCFASTALAQQPQQQQNTQPPQQQQAATEPPATRTVLKNRVFEVKYRDPDSLVSVLRLLGSGVGAMSVSNEYNTITVRDFPENIASIEEAIRRLDTPAPATPGVEFHVHILIATGTAAPSNQVPSELNDVIRQLQSTLSYKNYYVMTSAVLRTKEGPTGINNKGVADFKLSTGGAASDRPIFYEYLARQIKIDTTTTGAPVIQLGNFTFSMRLPLEVSPGQIVYERVGFETPVTMREGEKVVVGTTTMQDKGIIVVLTARIIK